MSHLEGIDDPIDLFNEIGIRPKLGGVRLDAQLIEPLLQGTDAIRSESKGLGAKHDSAICRTCCTPSLSSPCMASLR